MRTLSVIAVCLIVASAGAQEQERKLVHRLLEPNTKLENSQQHNQFTGASSVTTASASTHPFYVPEKKLSQNFTGARQFATTSFQSRTIKTNSVNLPEQKRTDSFATTSARDIVSAPNVRAKYETHQFAGSRPFLGRGKSQQALHAQDHPLSIDDIRELLNKNK